MSLLGKGKRRKHRNTVTIKRNTFGCVNVGNACKRSGQCCSGICTGKQGKQRCRAHDQSTCQPGPVCNAGDDVPCLTVAGDVGTCLTTTGRAGYCSGGGGCFACTRDTDCVPICGPQAACLACPDCIPSDGTQTVYAGPRADSCQFPP